MTAAENQNRPRRAAWIAAILITIVARLRTRQRAYRVRGGGRMGVSEQSYMVACSNLRRARRIGRAGALSKRRAHRRDLHRRVCGLLAEENFFRRAEDVSRRIARRH